MLEHLKARCGAHRRAALAATAVAVTVALTGSGAAASPAITQSLPTAASTGELVVNGTFDGGPAGWFASSQSLAVVQPTQGSAFARLSGRSGSTLVLNDRSNTVVDSAVGVEYRVSASVRTNTPKLNGQLRIREVGADSVVSHGSSFTLRDTAWHAVTLSVKTTKPGATLDLNVLAWNVTGTQRLDVDNVSMTVVPPPPPPPPPAPLGSECDGPLWTDRTYFGSSISTSGITAAESMANVDAAFGRVSTVRVFDPGLPLKWSSARAEVTAGRTLVHSFRPHPREVLAGTHDAALRAYFREAPADQVIFWSYIHEPEPLINSGSFTADEYRRAWQRIAGFAEDACRPNMHATLILTGWTAEPASGRSWRTYYPGASVIDVMAWDPYNGATDPDRSYYATPASIFANPVRASKEAGKPFAVAETGSRLVPGDDGSGRAAWLTSVGNYLKENDALFVTYFQSTRDGNWMLSDAPSRAAWGGLVGQ